MLSNTLERTQILQVLGSSESTKYVLDIQSELNYIIKKWYTNYQLHVLAITLAIIWLYSTLQSNYTIYLLYLGGRDLA